MATADLEKNSSSQSGDDGSKSRIAEATGKVRQSAREAYDAARERTTAVYGSAREKAGSAGRRAADGVDANPIAALAGGLALGAIVAAILPRTRREAEALGPVGKQLHARAREAFAAGRDAGQSKLEELGFSRDAAKQKLSDIASNAGEAFRASASAAVDAARSRQDQD